MAAMSKAHQRQQKANQGRRQAYRNEGRRETNAIIKLMRVLARDTKNNDALYALRKYSPLALNKARSKYAADKAFFDSMIELANKASKPKAMPAKPKEDNRSSNWRDDRKERDQDRDTELKGRERDTWANVYTFGQRAIVARNIARAMANNVQEIAARNSKTGIVTRVKILIPNSDSFNSSRIYSNIVNAVLVPMDFGMTWDQVRAVVGNGANHPMNIAA